MQFTCLKGICFIIVYNQIVMAFTVMLARRALCAILEGSMRRKGDTSICYIRQCQNGMVHFGVMPRRSSSCSISRCRIPVIYDEVYSTLYPTSLPLQPYCGPPCLKLTRC